MRRLVIGASTLVATIVLGATPVTAQFFVGGGATLPSGDFGDFAETGWMVNAGFNFWQGSGNKVFLYAEGLYGSNTHEVIDGDKTNIYGGLGTVLFNLGSESASVSPYLTGSIGYLVHQYKSDLFPDEEGSDGGIAFGGGAGLYFEPIYVEGRYMTFSVDGQSTAFLFFGAGITF